MSSSHSTTTASRILAIVAVCLIMVFALPFTLCYIAENRLKVYGPTRRIFHEHEKITGYVSGERIVEGRA